MRLSFFLPFFLFGSCLVVIKNSFMCFLGKGRAGVSLKAFCV